MTDDDRGAAADSPRFSVLTTVFDPEPEHLSACLASVDAQVARSWEHIVVDDRSTSAAVGRLLDIAAQPSDDTAQRTVIRRPNNGGIVAASNDALAAAAGEFVVLLDHDDVLTPDALEAMSTAIRRLEAQGRAPDVLYSDHDLLRVDGRCATPLYKPDFSIERLRNQNYITHLVVARRSLVEAVGGFRTGFDGAQDHDLLLRLAEAVMADGAEFVHVPEVLLHWRQSPASVSSNSMNKPEAYGRGCRAVADHLERCGIDAQVEQGESAGVMRIRRRIVGRPTVSVVIPTRGTRGTVWGVDRLFVHRAVSSLLADLNASACDLEIVAVIDAGSDPLVERGLRRLAGDRLVVVDYDQPFNFSDKINRGVAVSTGEYVLLLNDDTELIASGSIDEMVGLAQDPTVGLVGAKLLFEDGRLQHGGHVYNTMISHALLGFPGDHRGPYGLLVVARECSGVTAAATLLRRNVFDAVGGMNTDFAVNYNDVDFSLAVRESGLRNLWTPHASWYHFEQQSGEHPIDPAEIERIQATWGTALDHDPFYNVNLAAGRCDWLERPLASGAPPYEVLDDGRIAWA